MCLQKAGNSYRRVEIGATITSGAGPNRKTVRFAFHRGQASTPDGNKPNKKFFLRVEAEHNCWQRGEEIMHGKEQMIDSIEKWINIPSRVTSKAWSSRSRSCRRQPARSRQRSDLNICDTRTPIGWFPLFVICQRRTRRFLKQTQKAMM